MTTVVIRDPRCFRLTGPTGSVGIWHEAGCSCRNAPLRPAVPPEQRAVREAYQRYFTRESQ